MRVTATKIETQVYPLLFEPFIHFSASERSEPVGIFYVFGQAASGAVMPEVARAAEARVAGTFFWCISSRDGPRSAPAYKASRVRTKPGTSAAPRWKPPPLVAAFVRTPVNSLRAMEIADKTKRGQVAAVQEGSRRSRDCGGGLGA